MQERVLFAMMIKKESSSRRRLSRLVEHPELPVGGGRNWPLCENAKNVRVWLLVPEG